MVVHQNITNLAGYFHFLNVRKIPYVILTALSREASLHKIFKEHPLKVYPYFTALRNKRHGEIQRVFCSLQKHISQII